MKPIIEVKINSFMPIGYTPVEIHYNIYSYICCPWYLYWAIRPYYLAIRLKYNIYQWLNNKGIMKTPNGVIMHWKHLKIFNQRG